MLLRLAMLMTLLADLQTSIDAPHIDAAMAWIRHATASVRFVFVSAAEEAKLAQVRELSNRVLTFLRERGQARAARSTLSVSRARCRRRGSTPVWDISCRPRRPRSACSGESGLMVRRARRYGCTGWQSGNGGIFR